MPFNSPLDNAMFTIVPIMVTLGFVLVFGIILVNVFKGIGRWKYNNAQPILTVLARVVSKRADVSSHMHSDAGDISHHHTHAYTTYYVTFEVESGDRIEFNVQNSEYGLLVEGDQGKLTFQGTRYLGFKRGIGEVPGS